MSTDYSKLSDFEINSAVHNALMQEPYKIEFLGNDTIRWVRGSTDVTTGKVAYSNNSLKDYCNNPADAWPIIVGNKLSIVSLDNKWIAVPIDTVIDGITGDSEVCFYASSDAVFDVNPLRAAMIVFLMMQESKNAS